MKGFLARVPKYWVLGPSGSRLNSISGHLPCASRNRGLQVGGIGRFQSPEYVSRMHIHGVAYIHTYIYIYGHPPHDTHTPQKHCKCRYKRRFLFRIQFWSCFYMFENTSVKHKKSKNLKIHKSKNPKTHARFRRCKKFWIFGFVDFWISGCLYSGSLWISAHQQLHFHVQ